MKAQGLFIKGTLRIEGKNAKRLKKIKKMAKRCLKSV
jgi:hypothetical protein